MGNTFTDISGSAVIVDGVQTYQDLPLLNSTLGRNYKSIAEFASDQDSITGGTISNCGVEFPDSAGVLAGFAQDLIIGGIAISNLPADGIADGRSLNSYNGEDSGWYDPNPPTGVAPSYLKPPGSGTWCVCNIKNNQIHDVCLVMSDEGGIYLSGCNWDFQNTGEKGTVVEGNTIENAQLEKNKSKGTANVTLTAPASAAVNGQVSIALYASKAPSLAGATQLMPAATPRLAIKAGGSKTVRLPLSSFPSTLVGIEDNIRLCERASEFGPRFIELARSVYRTNDRHADLKRRVNAMLGSRLGDEKQYQAYD